MRLGTYLLPGDPVWLASSLARYYDILDDLVVVIPRDGIGWAGRAIPVDRCLDVIARCDTRGIRRTVTGTWVDHEHPMRADTAQRQAGLDALRDRVDWVLQLDNDEILPDLRPLLSLIPWADEHGLDAIEWPMRVLYRALGHGRFLEVANSAGQPAFEYPGPVLVRPTVTLINARRSSGRFLRPTVFGRNDSLQVNRPPATDERRLEIVAADDAIWHNSWGRPTADVHRKISTWGHASGWRSELYYALRWYPSPLTWRLMRDFHPFARGLWPRLQRVQVPATLLAPEDR